MILPNISPKFQMELIQEINDTLIKQYSNEDAERYLLKWHEKYDIWGDNTNFNIFYEEDKQIINIKETLHSIDGETLLKIAIDLGIATPDFVPCIPTFKNALKASYKTASQTFDTAFKNVETDPSLAIGLANSTLEGIIKEILEDERIGITYNKRGTLKKLTENICNAFRIYTDGIQPEEIRRLASSLINASQAIEDLRSDKTVFHGKTDEDLIVSDSIYSYFVVNATSTIGLFLLNFYKEKYPPVIVPETRLDDELPF